MPHTIPPEEAQGFSLATAPLRGCCAKVTATPAKSPCGGRKPNL